MEHSAALAQAITQFNMCEFFACHETLEPLWQAASGDEGIFLHAFIQFAVALHHFQNGNLKGALSVYQRARQKLRGLPATRHGLNLQQLCNELEAFFAAVYAAPAEMVSYPAIHLQSESGIGG